MSIEKLEMLIKNLFNRCYSIYTINETVRIDVLEHINGGIVVRLSIFNNVLPPINKSNCYKNYILRSNNIHR